MRVNIAYRPLRVCWAIKDGDFASFREAVRLNHALWGGRFNPIIVVDHLSEAHALVESFRVDLIIPLGQAAEVKEFADGYKHLISPFFYGGIYAGEGSNSRSQVLDIHNAIVHSENTPEWSQFKKNGPRIYSWNSEDPLSDIFLMQLGAYPEKDNKFVDYESIFKGAVQPSEVDIKRGESLAADLLKYPNISSLSRYQIRRHYVISSSWDYPGFFLGDASNFSDLVAFWNLRASDISLLFVDRSQIGRYVQVITEWNLYVSEMLAYRVRPEDRRGAIWYRSSDATENIDLSEIQPLIGSNQYIQCRVDEFLWNGMNLKPPLMYLGESTSLGVQIDDDGAPKISFGLGDRPYANDVWFHTQHLVASVSFVGGLFGNNDFTLNPPYIPELNEFYARSMRFQYNQLRIESERIGLIIDAVDGDSFVYALPTDNLYEKVFELAGFKVKVSRAGLIARQLMTQLGGVQGARVFKIPGVRRLIKEHGPTSSFRKREALNLIGSADPEDPTKKFKDYEGLYLEPRDRNSKLDPTNVFDYLVRKKLFRIGMDLVCPHCGLKNWFPVDDLSQRVNCQMCDKPYDATSQLVNSEWWYRRSGVLGAERNAQGAIPVALILQQLDANLGIGRSYQYSVSLELEATKGQAFALCEVDFVWLIPRPFSEKTIIVIGECKDQGRGSHTNGGGTISENDIAKLRSVADSFPTDRFEVYIVLAKLCDFTQKEIELAKSLNDRSIQRVILFTDRELEPFRFYERTEKMFKVGQYGGSVRTLASATISIFFNPQSID